MLQVRERKCQRRPLEPQPLGQREQLLVAIRSEPKLKPTAHGQRRHAGVETSRTRLYDDNDSGAGGDQQQAPAAKKVIKPNMSFQLNTFSVRDYVYVCVLDPVI